MQQKQQLLLLLWCFISLLFESRPSQGFFRGAPGAGALCAGAPWGPSIFSSVTLLPRRFLSRNNPVSRALRAAPQGPLRAGRGPPLDTEEYLKLRNTVANLSEFQGGQEMLQEQETEHWKAREAEDAAYHYRMVRLVFAPSWTHVYSYLENTSTILLFTDTSLDAYYLSTATPIHSTLRMQDGRFFL